MKRLKLWFGAMWSSILSFALISVGVLVICLAWTFAAVSLIRSGDVAAQTIAAIMLVAEVLALWVAASK